MSHSGREEYWLPGEMLDHVPNGEVGLEAEVRNGRFRADSLSNLCEVLTDRWLERRGAVTAIYEQVVLQRAGWATTLLVVEDEEVYDEANDRNWNRRNLQ